jgi:predicted transcriptional regulator
LAEIGQGTVAEILVKLPSPPGYNSVRKLLSILEDEGHVVHAKLGKQYVYRPAREPSIVGQAALRDVLKRYFGGSLERAVACYVSDPDTKLTAAQLGELQNILSQVEACSDKEVRGSKKKRR